jgi:serine/threonine protein kinase
MVSAPGWVGRYRVEAVIGAGGFATVYRAIDDRLDAVVAVKVLAENHCLDPDVRERFLKEGRVLRRIGSSHVVGVHDLGETEQGQPYLVLDHADRGTLAGRSQARRAGGWLPGAADVLHVARALADSLAAVHVADVVHRDIAPRNLLLRSTRAPAGERPCGLVDADERLLLADLGLSKDLAVASGLTVGGGTAGFTPPEQRHAAARVDARADIWAATAVLVWLLVDHPPDDAGGWRADVAAGGWPPALIEALVRGLAADPGARFPSVTDWHEAVVGSVQPTVPLALGTPASPPAPPTGNAGPPATLGASPTRLLPPAPAVRPARRPSVAVAAVLLVLLAVAAGTAVMLQRRNGGTDQTVERLDGGVVRVSARAGDRRVAVTGPSEVRVGDTASFTAAVTGVEHWVWFGPDGGVHPDVDQIDVATASAGVATVRLEGVDRENRAVEVVHRFDVVD